MPWAEAFARFGCFIKSSLILRLGLGLSLMPLSINPSLTTLVFLSADVWDFCRFFCFYFYVIDKNIDPGSRHSSLSVFVLSLFRQEGDCEYFFL